MELTLILLIRKKNEGKKITILEYKIVSQIGQVLQSTVTGTRAQGGGFFATTPPLLRMEFSGKIFSITSPST